MEQFVPNFRDRQVMSSVKTLTLFTFAVVCLPLGTMFGMKSLVFESNNNNQEISCFKIIIGNEMILFALQNFFNGHPKIVSFIPPFQP